MRSLNLILAVCFILLAGCASKPMVMSNQDQGNWRARALIKDKELSRSFIVVLDFNAVRRKSTRLDVTSTLGQQVASLVVNDSTVNYHTADAKKFYTSAPRPEALRPILSIPLDPRWLQNILFEEPIPAKSWTCKSDKDGFLIECKDKATELTISWRDRKGVKRRIDLVHPKAEIQISFISFSPKISKPEKLFTLDAPSGYQKIKLR